jgi:uncharacterized protein
MSHMGTPGDADVVTELPEPDCWEVLGRRELGRLAFHLLDEVHITPINYAAHRGRIYFCTAEGSKLLGVTMNHDVAFEVDEHTEDSAISVVVRGNARRLGDAEQHIVEQLPLRSWVPTAKLNVVVIEPTEVTGRAFRLDRPWLHMVPHGRAQA